MGLWSTLDVGRSALRASELALQIASHNIANAATPGYARQRLALGGNPPLNVGSGVMIGAGVDVVAVQAMVDRQLEERMRHAASEVADFTIRHTYLARAETMLNELGDASISTAIGEFFTAVDDLQTDATDIGLRQIVVQRAANLADSIRMTRARLDQARIEVDGRVETAVGEVNRLIREIAEANRLVVEREAGDTGGLANDLRNQRAEMLNDLAHLVEIRTVEIPSGAVNVLLGSQMLVQNQRVDQLQMVSETDRGLRRTGVRLAGDGSLPTLRSGELAGMIAARDDILGGLVDDLDLLARSLVGEVNRVHSMGTGLQPFNTLTSGEMVADPGAVLNAAGLTSTPVHGRFDITVFDQATGVGVTTTINVDLDGIGTDSTLTDVAAALDAVDGISASVNSHYRLVIEADSGQMAFAFSDDSSGLLAALGLNTLFSGYDSRTVAVVDRVAEDVSWFAAGRSGDGEHAASNLGPLFDVRSTPVADLDGLTLSEFLETSVTTLAIQTASARDGADAAGAFHGVLTAEREAHSGVSIDEETLDLIRFQRTFQAAARVISTVDELMKVLLNL